MKKVLSFILCLTISAIVSIACFEKKQVVDANATLKSASPDVKKEVVVKEKAPKKVTKKKAKVKVKVVE